MSDLDTSPHVVLVVENEHEPGRDICRGLRELGMEPIWLISIRLTEHGFSGECMDDRQMSEPPQRFKGHWTNYAVVFMDGVLGITDQPEHGPHGWDLVPLIVAAGIPCIAISSVFASNHRMLALGARYSTSTKGEPANFKEVIGGFLRELHLVPEAAATS